MDMLEVLNVYYNSPLYSISYKIEFIVINHVISSCNSIVLEFDSNSSPYMDMGYQESKTWMIVNGW